MRKLILVGFLFMSSAPMAQADGKKTFTDWKECLRVSFAIHHAKTSAGEAADLSFQSCLTEEKKFRESIGPRPDEYFDQLKDVLRLIMI